MTQVVFYSWQSDRPTEVCRGFVKQALTQALKVMRHNGFDVVGRPDEDARELPGSPEIDAAIAAKIDRCEAFVGDVTIVAPRDKHEDGLINSNVAVEVGFALKSLGEQRVILVANKHFGDRLPFDVRNRLIVFYDLAPLADHAVVEGDDESARKPGGDWEARSTSERDKLADRLRGKLRDIFSGGATAPPPTIDSQLATLREYAAKVVKQFAAPVLGTFPAEYKTWLQIETLGICWEKNAPSEEDRKQLGEPHISSTHTSYGPFSPEQDGWVRKPGE